MRRVWQIAVVMIALLAAVSAAAQHSQEDRRIRLADPFILLHDNTYYAYGTHNRNGIEYYTSTNLKEWHYGGLALHKNDSYGEKWFWAPEVYHIDGKFYMYYTAQERICVAVADSPKGPFRQLEKEPMLPEQHTIDNTLFIDDDGTPYLFYVHIKKGFHIKMAELERDLTTIKHESIKSCITPRQKWERLEGKVNEGPSILKHNGKYYMLYSGNGYKSKLYGVGVAVANNIRGPWKKLANNPIFQLPEGLFGTGHGAPFYDKRGRLHYVFHAHNSAERVHPRFMCISRMAFRRINGAIQPVISENYRIPQIVKQPKPKL